MTRYWEVLIGWETAVECLTACCLVRAESDWLAIPEAEERVRFVFKLADTVPVKPVRARGLTLQEAWDVRFTRGPLLSRTPKQLLSMMAAEG
jgi:hypothetical protein